MRHLLAALLLVAGLITPHAAHAQSAPAEARNDERSPARHRVSLGLGLLPQATAEPGTAQISGHIASLAYAHRIAPTWEVEVSASLHGTEATFGEAATVTSLLMGVNVYPSFLAPAASVRPYLTGALGPYVGTAASGLTASAHTETVVGVRLGGGIDVQLSRWVRAGLRGAYHAAPRYGEPVGDMTTPRGGQLSLELGVTFGGR